MLRPKEADMSDEQQLRQIITANDGGTLSNAQVADIVAAILDAGWRPGVDNVEGPHPARMGSFVKR